MTILLMSITFIVGLFAGMMIVLANVRGKGAEQDLYIKDLEDQLTYKFEGVMHRGPQ